MDLPAQRIRAVMQQCLDDLHVAAVRCVVQRRRASLVGNRRPGALLGQIVNDGVVALERGEVNCGDFVEAVAHVQLGTAVETVNDCGGG